MSESTLRMIKMCSDAWQSMNTYTDQFDKGSKGVASVEVDAIDLVNWCQVIAMATRSLHERITNENLSSLQYNNLLGKYEKAIASAQTLIETNRRVTHHLAGAVEFIEKQYPNARQLDRGPIMRNMRRWRDQLSAALANIGAAK